MSLLEKIRARNAAKYAEKNNTEQNKTDVKPTEAVEEKQKLTPEHVAKIVDDIKTGKKKPDKIEGQPDDNEKADDAGDAAESAPVTGTAVAEGDNEDAAESPETANETASADKASEESEAENKPKKRRRRRTKKEIEEDNKKQENAKANEASAEEAKPDIAAAYGNMNVLGHTMSFDEAAQIVLDEFGDDGWKEFEKDVNEKMDAIRIEPDMNPGTLKYVLHDLDVINDMIAIPLIETRKLLDALTEKDFGMAIAIRNSNYVGKNTEERMRNGMLALVNTDIGDHKINLVALTAAARMRWTFLNAISNRIKYKSNICITMSSALKMERNLIPGQEY